MRIILSDNPIDGVDVSFPDNFVFDDYEQAIVFIKLVREWHNKSIEENKKKMIESARSMKG